MRYIERENGGEGEQGRGGRMRERGENEGGAWRRKWNI